MLGQLLVLVPEAARVHLLEDLLPVGQDGLPERGGTGKNGEDRSTGRNSG